jgi:hypothetical protein
VRGGDRPGIRTCGPVTVSSPSSLRSSFSVELVVGLLIVVDRPRTSDATAVARVQRRLQAEHGLAALQRSGDTMQRLRPAASIALRSQRNLDALVARDHADTEIHR